MPMKCLVQITSRKYVGCMARTLATTRSPFSLQNSNRTFQNTLPDIINEVFANNTWPPQVADRLKKITNHTLDGGKKMRANLVLQAYEMLEQPEYITEKSLHQIRVLAWTVEMVHSYFIILDDLEDGATTRRGKPCWHLLNDSTINQAPNDASLLRSFIYFTLTKNFENVILRNKICNLFHTAFLNTAIGQYLDFESSKTNKNLANFTTDKYESFVDYKTSYYTFKFPIYLAMCFANDGNKETLEYVDNICTDIGRLVQMQNDYFDCYSKDIGTDIQKGKCTWLAIEALKRCSKAQQIVFTSCYGSDEPAHIERIKRLYDQLQIPKVYKEHEKLNTEKIINKTRNFPDSALKPELFMNILDNYDLNK